MEESRPAHPRSYKLEGHLTGDKPCPPLHIRRTTTTEGTSRTGLVVNGESISQTTIEINPLYESWLAIDQLILGWLYNLMSHEVTT